MNEEKWTLAVIKRYVLQRIRECKGVKDAKWYETEPIVNAMEEVLSIIVTAESDAVLGTPEMIDGYVEHLLDVGAKEEVQ